MFKISELPVLDKNLPNLAKNELFSLLDLTLLSETASQQVLEEFFNKAIKYRPAAICTYSNYLARMTVPPSLQIATVVNFPEGNQSLFEVEKALIHNFEQNNIDEIDYVFPYQRYLEGEHQIALEHCKQSFRICRDHHILFKVIVETGAFQSYETLYAACAGILELGCDFLKTSTGKTAVGATPEASFTLLSAIKNINKKAGFKVSGGIRTEQQANFYINLAEHILQKKADNTWFRIGASSLFD